MNSKPFDPPVADGRNGESPTISSGDGPMFPMKRMFLWGTGFVVLFAVNVLVELLILPELGLVDTPKNDVYFKSWWIVVGIWFVFGNAILAAFETTPPKGHAGNSRVSE